MNNKVVNKQIPIKSIIDIANYMEDYKERYDKIFQDEENKNKGKSFGEKNYEYENGYTRLEYTIEFHNGKRLTESDYNWFVGNLNQTRMIKEIYISLSIAYNSRSNGSDYNDIRNNIHANVEFRDCGMELKYSDVTINIDTTNQENEAHNIYSTIMNTLENNPDRYDKTIKGRKLRIQSFTISIGIILSYILYIVLLINKSKFPVEMGEFLNNKNILIFGQWFVAILLGNVFSYWYILGLYRPLLPETKYAGYDRSTYKSKYKDDIDDYVEHSEVHFGKFWDAENRRNKIEKIYKITRIILLVQLVVSIILYLVIK